MGIVSKSPIFLGSMSSYDIDIKSFPRYDITQHHDAEFILDEDEWALDWRYGVMPASFFSDVGARGVRSATPALTRIKDPKYRAKIELDDEKRLAPIREWAAARGGLDTALTESPLIALSNGNLLDGWHRFDLWVKRFGTERPIPTAVGILPPGKTERYG